MQSVTFLATDFNSDHQLYRFSPSDSPEIDLRIAQGQLEVDFDSSPDSYYAIMIVDYNAVGLQRHSLNGLQSNKLAYLHYLEINLPASSGSGQVIVEYQKPTPPRGSGLHRYAIYILKQPTIINVSDIEINNRLNFELDQFVMDYQLQLIGYFIFFTRYSESEQFTEELGTGSYQQFQVEPIQMEPIQLQSTQTQPIEEQQLTWKQLPQKQQTGQKQQTQTGQKQPTEQMFRSGSLGEREEKYCSCVLDVAAKQGSECLSNRDYWGSSPKVPPPSGKTCYNPYAVCAKSTRTSSRNCGSSYNFDQLSDTQLNSYVQLNRIPVSGSSRQNLIDAIQNWKQTAGH